MVARRASLLTVLALVAGTPCAVADPNALWDIVNGQCVPAQLTAHRPAPCAHVDLAGGYAVLKDLVGATQFLLIPTARVAGIESPEILAWNAPNYFADAWRARAYVEHRAGRGLPCDWVSVAVNSAAARSQSQLHIHVDCVRADVRQALATHAQAIGPTWSAFPVPLAGQRYRAIAVPGDGLDGVNPFRLLADGLAGGDVMGAQTRWRSGAPASTERPDSFCSQDAPTPLIRAAAMAKTFRITTRARRLPR